MRIFRLLTLLLALHIVLPHTLTADEGAQPPLKLAPGSGVQSPNGQAAPPPPGLLPGQGRGGGEQVQLRDIHPPLALPEKPDYRIVLGGLLLLLLLFGLITWFFWYRRGKEREKRIPAHETALAELMALRSAMNPDQALYYGGELGDILRRYIEKRFHIRTSRQTTREFFRTLTSRPERYDTILAEHGENLKVCLDQCDMAKFAHCPPDLGSMEKMEAAVRNFIEHSRESNGEEK